MSSHLICYLARMQDAGLVSLWISLGSDASRRRLIHVSPSRDAEPALAARFPTRTFLIDGTDEKLQALENEMIFDHPAVTGEMVDDAIAANPEYAHELNLFRADWVGANRLDEFDDSGAPTADDEAMAKRSAAFARGMLRAFHANHGSDKTEPPAAA